MRSLADKFREALLNNYDQAQREIGVQVPEFLRVLDVHGAVDVARQVIHGSGAGLELRRGLRQGKRLELSVEATMLRPEFAPLFIPAELAAARDTLSQYGYHAPWDTGSRTARPSARASARSEPAAEIPPVPRSALVMALEVFDREQRRRPEWRGWERHSILRMALRHDGRLYPIKEILRMATGVGAATRDEDAVEYVRKRGFDVTALPQNEPEPEPEPASAPASASVPVPAPAPAFAPVPVPAPAPTAAHAPEPAPPAIPDAGRDDLLVALKIFDGDERTTPEWLGWEQIAGPQGALFHEGRPYPLAEIIRLATGTQDAFTDDQAAEWFRRHGFEVAAAQPVPEPQIALLDEVAAAPEALAVAAPPAPEAPATDHVPPAPDSGLPAPDTGLPTSDSQLPTPVVDLVRTAVKRYAGLAQCDLRGHYDWLRARLDLGEALDTTPLIDAEGRETLALARYLWTDLERHHAEDYSAPALLLIAVLEHAAQQSLSRALLSTGTPDGPLEALAAQRAAVEHATTAVEWRARIARGQAYTIAQWLDALPAVVAIRAQAARGERVDQATFHALIDLLCGTPLAGAGVLNGLLCAWIGETAGAA